MSRKALWIFFVFTIGLMPVNAQDIDIDDIINVLQDEAAHLFESDGGVSTQWSDWTTLQVEPETQFAVSRVQIGDDPDQICIYVNNGQAGISDMACKDVPSIYELTQIADVTPLALPPETGVALEGYVAYLIVIEFDMGPVTVQGMRFLVQAPIGPTDFAMVG